MVLLVGVPALDVPMLGADQPRHRLAWVMGVLPPEHVGLEVEERTRRGLHERIDELGEQHRNRGDDDQKLSGVGLPVDGRQRPRIALDSRRASAAPASSLRSGRSSPLVVPRLTIPCEARVGLTESLSQRILQQVRDSQRMGCLEGFRRGRDTFRRSGMARRYRYRPLARPAEFYYISGYFFVVVGFMMFGFGVARREWQSFAYSLASLIFAVLYLALLAWWRGRFDELNPDDADTEISRLERFSDNWSIRIVRAVIGSISRNR